MGKLKIMTALCVTRNKNNSARERISHGITCTDCMRGIGLRVVLWSSPN